MIVNTIDIVNPEDNTITRTRVNELRANNTTSIYNMFDSYKSIAKTNRSRLNTEVFEFNERFSDIISQAILLDNMYLLSPEQRILMDRYFSKATGDVLVTVDVILTLLGDEDLKQLDTYLGGI